MGKCNYKYFTYAVTAWIIVTTIAVIMLLNGDLPVQHKHEAVQPVVVECPHEVIIEVPDVICSNEPVAYYADIASAMTPEDWDLLEAVLHLEANNQSLTGQKAVVEVIFNRVRHPDFPDTIRDVLYQRGQFSTISRVGKAEPNATQHDAIVAVLNETVPMMPGDVVFFATKPVNGTFYERIGGHYFSRG